jgi:hypothetical protein
MIVWLLFFLPLVKAHGFLCDPPSRNAAWMCGFPNDHPKNYDQMALNAGGISVVYPNYPNPVPQLYGVCGDPYNSEQLHGSCGVHSRGVRRTIHKGEVFNTIVNVTAYHKGFFEFQLCPSFPETEECFKTIHTHSIDEVIQPSYIIPLTFDTTCEQCVLRWKWTTNNSPGMAPELFINCADVQII